jgi:hypothetical protein
MDRIRQNAKALCCWSTPEHRPASSSPSSAQGGSVNSVLSAATSGADARRRELEDRLSVRLPRWMAPTTGSVFADPPSFNTERTPLLNRTRSLLPDTYGSITLGSTSSRLSFSSSSSNSLSSPFPDLPAMGNTDPASSGMGLAAPLFRRGIARSQSSAFTPWNVASHSARHTDDAGSTSLPAQRLGQLKKDPDEEDVVDVSHHQDEPSSASSELAWWDSSRSVLATTEDISASRPAVAANQSALPPAIFRTYGDLFPGLSVASAASSRQLPYMPVIGSEPSTTFVLQPRRERVEPPQVNLNAAEAEAAAAAAADSPRPASLSRPSE